MQGYELAGNLVYDPYRHGFRKTHKMRTLILRLPRDDLTAYYRWVVKRRYWLDLQAPMWDNHITIISGKEKVPVNSLWKAHQNERIVFTLLPNIYKFGPFWVVSAESKRFNQLRVELGLKPWDEFHLTIGREYSKEAA